MEENMVNNNNGTEEVPLDLFNQVSLDEFEPVEIVDLEEKPKEEPSNTVISIPADAYAAALAKMNNSSSQSNN